MSEILDDMDSRPGSTTSLLRTVIGIYLRELGGWMSAAQLLELMEALDVAPPLTRTALARLKKRGLLLSESRGRVAGYRVAAEAEAMLSRGDRRIYHPRTMPDEGLWCVVSFSIPEEHRSLRHQLRRRLHWIGCGTVSPALWICPAYLADEVMEILDDLGVREHSTVFLSQRPIVADDLVTAVARWWDLPSLREHHDEFLEVFESQAISDVDATPDGPDPRSAFAAYIRAIDAWRIIPYIDPGLPAALLPDDWPGEASNGVMRGIRSRFSRAATAFVVEVTGVAIEDPARVADADARAWEGRGSFSARDAGVQP